MAPILTNDNQLILSFRHLLVEALSEFNREVGWPDGEFAEMLTETLTGLAKHREEGKRLLPTVFFTRDLNDLLTTTQGGDAVVVGRGPVNGETARRMLKVCAPLSEGRNWVIFAVLNKDDLTYGVYCAPPSPLEPTALENLRQVSGGLPAHLGLVQLAENVIEIRGNAEHFRFVHLSGAVPFLTRPMKIMRRFLAALTFDIPEKHRIEMRRLYYRLLMDVLRNWHGSLVAVLRKGSKLPDFLNDGIHLDPPIDLLAYAESFSEDGSYASGARLKAQMNLVQGMLASDGVVIFSSDGKLLGFNIFVRHAGDLEVPFQPLGGARRRTFESMKNMTNQDMVAAFFRSQDGNVSSEVHHSLGLKDDD